MFNVISSGVILALNRNGGREQSWALFTTFWDAGEKLLYFGYGFFSMCYFEEVKEFPCWVFMKFWCILRSSRFVAAGKWRPIVMDVGMYILEVNWYFPLWFLYFKAISPRLIHNPDSCRPSKSIRKGTSTGTIYTLKDINGPCGIGSWVIKLQVLWWIFISKTKLVWAWICYNRFVYVIFVSMELFTEDGSGGTGV